MYKILLLLFLSFSLNAQDSSVATKGSVIGDSSTYGYVSLSDNKVYDVEIIIFAYQNALPNNKTYQNKSVFDDSSALDLKFKPNNLSDIKYITMESTNLDVTDALEPVDTENSEYTIPITDETNNKQALVWFEHKPKDYKLTTIWKRLIKQSNIVPLVHKAWRQAETPFENPTYVKLSNIVTNKRTNQSFNKRVIIKNSASINAQTIDANGEFFNTDNLSESSDTLQENIYSDFTLTGMVALSQGRFMHFGHKINLFRTYNNNENELKNMIFSLIERKQLETDELNYFDSPWFGSIVKITEFTGEEANDE